MSNKIYIKKIPDKERLTREETVELLNSPYAPRDEIEQFRELLKSMGRTMDEFLDDVFALGSNNGAFREEWSGCKNFWTCAENEDGIIMSEHILNEEAAEKEFKSQEELEKEFISINSFLENANYVGKFFRRTKRIYEDDKEYLPVNHNVFALYELDGIILAIKQKDGKTVFDIIPSQLTRDGNYELYGSQKVSFDNKKEINKEIVKHLKNQL